MIEVIGKEGIRAKVIQDSICPNTGSRLVTYEIEALRMFWSEVLTHCMLEKNASSSRAIPNATFVQMIAEDPAMPVYWGKNRSGMVAGDELTADEIIAAKDTWKLAAASAVEFSKKLSVDHGLHKQISNRVIEPFQRIKAVMTGTEWENFFWLRDHPAAQPEFQELAKVMRLARSKSTPVELNSGEWHLPYVERKRGTDGVLRYFSNDVELTVQEAQMVSASCCAQVSYRKNDDSLDKAADVFKKLNIGSSVDPAHASPCTHQGTPIDVGTIPFDPSTWQEGITHVSRDGSLWSGKLKGYVQYRKLIPNEAKW